MSVTNTTVGQKQCSSCSYVYTRMEGYVGQHDHHSYYQLRHCCNAGDYMLRKMVMLMMMVIAIFTMLVILHTPITNYDCCRYYSSCYYLTVFLTTVIAIVAGRTARTPVAAAMRPDPRKTRQLKTLIPGTNTIKAQHVYIYINKCMTVYIYIYTVTWVYGHRLWWICIHT